MSHYYSQEQTDVKSEKKIFEYNFKGVNFKFNSDNGVFSKDNVDYGSYVLLKAFKPVVDFDGNRSPYPILDMGAGYGPIGIIISRMHNIHTVMCEINERAYNLCQENIILNNADAEVRHSDLYEKIGEEEKFQAILTNPPIRAGKAVVYKIFEESKKYLAEDGKLWVVIQKKQGEESARKYLKTLFTDVDIVTRDRGYYILKAYDCLPF